MSPSCRAVSGITAFLLCPFLFQCYAPHRALHSFPTRRSSDPHAVEPVCCLGPADLIAFEQCVLVEQAVDLRQQCSALARGGMLYFKLVQVLFLFCVFNRRPGGGWADAAGGSQQDYGSQNKSAQHGNSLSS